MILMLTLRILFYKYCFIENFLPKKNYKLNFCYGILF